jgi:hypothetical protein
MGDKLIGLRDYCVYAICESNISNVFFFTKNPPSFPAQCYLEIQTTTGKIFRSKTFRVDEIFEDNEVDGVYTRKKVDYSKQ